MIILAIDPGQRSGWALSEPALSGAVDHERAAMEGWWGEDRPERGMASAWTKSLDKVERLKRVLGVYATWLERLISYHKPSVVILERQKPFRGRSGTNVLEFRGTSLAVAGRCDAALIECEPRAWQRLLAQPYDPAKDHHVAAELMLQWWAAEQRVAA